MAKESALRAGDQEFDPHFLLGNFSGVSHASDLKIGTPVATLPGVIELALGLTGLASVHFDWVR